MFRQDGRYFWLIAALFTVFLPHTAMAESRLTAAAGAFDFFKGNHVSAAAAFELRGPVISPSWQSETFLGFAPTLGVLATSDEGGLVYAMIELPFVLGPQKNYEVSLSGGFAAYEQGDSALDMGGTAQFVYDKDGKQLVDTILRYEEIEEGFATVVDKLGITDIELDRFNQSYHAPWTEAYALDTFEMVKQFAQPDADAFGYPDEASAYGIS